MYLIKYSTYPKGLMPYNYYSLPINYVKYNNREEEVEFEFYPIARKEGSIEMLNVNYWIYISVEGEKMHDMVSCGVGNSYK